MPRYQGAKSQNIPIDQRVDTRRWTKKKADAWTNPDEAFFLDMILVGLNLLLLIIPVSILVTFLPSFLLSKNFLHPKNRLHNMPLRVPKYLHTPDGSKSIPNKPFRIKKNRHLYDGEGVTMFGMDLETNLQVWGTNSDDRTHTIILGTTGSGKTEFIYVLLLNQLIQNSGFIAVDAKGDISFWRRVCQLLRRFGREDDSLAISFAVGDRDFMQAQPDKATNTFNIMSATSAGMLIELLSGMLDDGGSGGDMWQGRAIAFIAALTRPLTYLRDKKEIDLSPSKYMEYMELAEIERLAYENEYKYAGFDEVLKPLKGYLLTLPGYDSKKRGSQETTTLEQFGYITMQLTRSLNDLSYNYGHIFGVDTGEIDISDVVLNRRCMTVLLPALERSLPTLNMLGKLIIGSIKQMMAGSLGSRLDGLIRLTIESRPTSANNAFRIVLDEVGYMMVVGMSVIPAQARSLNISMVFAAQTYTDIKRGSPEEAEAIWGNTNYKFIGRITDGDISDTFTKAKSAAGEVDQTYIDGYSERTNAMGDITYKGSQTARRERRSRLDYDDIAGQENGQFTMIIPKKEDGGKVQGARVIKLQGLFTGGGAESNYTYCNDLIPVSNTEKVDDGSERLERLYYNLLFGNLSRDMNNTVRLANTAPTLLDTSPKANTAIRANGLLADTLIQIDEKIKALTSNENSNPMPLATVYTTLSHFANLISPVNEDTIGLPTDVLDRELDLNIPDTINSDLSQGMFDFTSHIDDYSPANAHLQDTLERESLSVDKAFMDMHPELASDIAIAKHNQSDLAPIAEKITAKNNLNEPNRYDLLDIEDEIVSTPTQIDIYQTTSENLSDAINYAKATKAQDGKQVVSETKSEDLFNELDGELENKDFR